MAHAHVADTDYDVAVIGAGFALLVAAGMTLRGRVTDWRRGLIWGASGFLAFSFLPALGLPPPLEATSPCRDPRDPASESAAEQVAAQETTSAAAAEWHGTACSPGRVRGKVALVSNPRAWLEGPGATAIEPRILVAACTDPGWVLLFPQACALLVERGSVLSHVAIVARELGLPMVTELAGLSSLLQNDDWLEIDGGSGLVRRCAGPKPGTW